MEGSDTGTARDEALLALDEAVTPMTPTPPTCPVNTAHSSHPWFADDGDGTSYVCPGVLPDLPAQPRRIVAALLGAGWVYAATGFGHGRVLAYLRMHHPDVAQDLNVPADPQAPEYPEQVAAVTTQLTRLAAAGQAAARALAAMDADRTEGTPTL